MEEDNSRRPSERRTEASRRTRPTAPNSHSSRSDSRDQRQDARSRQRAARPHQQTDSGSRPVPRRSSRRKEAPSSHVAHGTSEASQPSRQRPTYSVPRQDRNQDSAYQRRGQSASGARRREKHPHRVYHTNFGLKFLTMLAVVAVIVISMMIFFKVKHIEVVLLGVDAPASTSATASDATAADFPPGDTKTAPDSSEAPGETNAASERDGQAAVEKHHSYYSAEEIIAASGIQIDDNLLSLSKASVASHIHAALPYVNQIQIKKELPGTIVITVSEFDITYGIQDEQEGWWLMSREGRILEPATEESLRDHLLITGMLINVPKVGDWFKPSAAQGADMSEISAKQKAVLAIIPALEETPFFKEIERVDVSTSYNVSLWYGTRYEIRLGTVENLSYKLRFLAATLADKEIQHRSG
ncbi:MAG: FtsQ-type POTRA domain-containing protein, partial [Oscillospiraceae bacterium]|nr:FtsQ-type POTRA domain-containing protein [Oscillospiraceae bacterium]